MIVQESTDKMWELSFPKSQSVKRDLQIARCPRQVQKGINYVRRMWRILWKPFTRISPCYFPLCIINTFGISTASCYLKKCLQKNQIDLKELKLCITFIRNQNGLLMSCLKLISRFCVHIVPFSGCIRCCRNYPPTNFRQHAVVPWRTGLVTLLIFYLTLSWLKNINDLPVGKFNDPF